MPRYLNTRGKPTLAIAICARCSVKYPRDDLRPDPNSPGLMCCPDGCIDQYDPYRLAPRGPDKIALEWSRPDVTILPGPQSVPVWALQAGVGIDPGVLVDGTPGVLQVGVDEVLQVAPGLVLRVSTEGGTSYVPSPGLSLIEAIAGVAGIAAADAVTTIQQPVQWTAGTFYSLGAQIVPVDPVGATTAGLMFQTFTCIYPGISGSVAPSWPTREGISVEDGDAWWISAGVYMP